MHHRSTKKSLNDVPQQRHDSYARAEIIAEVKTHSPFGWESERGWDELFDLACSVGDVISIHTDARWGGSFELIQRARARTELPILAKGIHASDDEVRRAIEYGADRVLVVGRIPDEYVEQCMIEPMTVSELARLPATARAVWNSRDLNTGGAKDVSFADARRAFSGWLCQASHIRTVDDIEEDADAVLVGTHLAEFASSLENRA